MPHAHDPAGSPAPAPAHSHGHGHGHGDAHQHSGSHQHGDHGGSASHRHGDAHSEMLDLDAEVAATPIAELITHAAALTTTPVRHIVDIGSGTGTGTFALLRHFPEATVTAIDTSDEMLSHLTRSAAGHGLAGRIRPLRADLDEGWPSLEPADLIWASSSLHHMAQPDQVLRDARATLTPGGVLVVIEMEHLPRFLPDEVGPGLEARLHAVSEKVRDEHLPHMGAPWPALLAGAGFTVRDERALTVDLPAPLPPHARRYARATLQRLSQGMADRLTPEDRDSLQRLLTAPGPESLEHRPDLTVRSSRNTWLSTPA